jgi:antirestriction protein ArdC
LKINLDMGETPVSYMGTMNTNNMTAPKKKSFKAYPKKKPANAQVNDLILERMRDKELGPWDRDYWCAGNDLANLSLITIPRNLSTGDAYSGSNIFTLALAGFGNEYWLTFNQALDLALTEAKAAGRKIEKRFDLKNDGTPSKRFKYIDAATGEMFKVIKSGETGTLACRWVPKYYDANDKVVDKDDPTMVRVGGFSSTFKVFNVEQTLNVSYPKPVPAEPLPEATQKLQAIAAAEAILDGYVNAPSIEFRLLGPKDSPHYSILRDVVVLGLLKQYKSSESFYKTKFHELVHSTGAAHRLKRAGIVNFDKFGSDQYSREELIAELGGAYLSMLTGCWGERQVDNSAAYLKGWMSKLEEDPSLFCTAASQAQKAVEFILGCAMSEWQAPSSS